MIQWAAVKGFLFAQPPRGHAETVPERRQRWFENVMAIIMAVAAILATWASFEASRWGGEANGLWDKAAIVRAESNRFAAKAVEETAIDSAVWLEWEKSVLLNRDDLAGFLRDRFSPALDSAQVVWLSRSTVDAEGNPADGTLPKGTPLTLDEYVPPGQEKAERFSAEAESLLQESASYGDTGGKYTLLTIMFALVLFFGSVATKFTSPKIQLSLGSLSLVLLLVAVAKMLLLPIM